MGLYVSYKIIYPNCLKYSKSHATCQVHFRIPFDVTAIEEKSIIDKINSKKFKNFTLNLYILMQTIYKPLDSNKGRRELSNDI